MAQSLSLVRPRFLTPSHHDQGKSLPSCSNQIAFRHPGYDDPLNIILFIPGLDLDGGVHHATALVICGILADNRWDGYFSEDKEGQRKVEIGSDDTLKGESFYFQLPNTTSGE